MGTTKSWLEQLRALPNWIKGVVGFVTLIIGFATLFQQNPYLSITISSILVMLTIFPVSLYIFLSKKESSLVGGKPVYRFPRYRVLAISVGLFTLISLFILSWNKSTRSFAVVAFQGTPTPTITHTPTSTPTITPTATATSTPTPTNTPDTLTYLLDNERVIEFFSTANSSSMLEGYIVDEQGVPMQGVRILMQGFDLFDKPSVTDENGYFQISYNLEYSRDLVLGNKGPIGYKLFIGDNSINGNFVLSDSFDCWSMEPDEYCSVVDVREVTRRLLDSSQQSWSGSVSQLRIERVLTRATSSAENQDSIYEIWLKNTSDTDISVTNIGILFRREEPYVQCCCPTGEPYNYRVEVTESMDAPGVSFELEDSFIETVNDEPEHKRLKYVGKLVSRQWCNFGLMAVTFPTNVNIPATTRDVIRILFPQNSDLSKYDFEIPEMPSESRGEVAETPTPMPYISRTFDIFIFDEYGNVASQLE